MSAGHGDHSDLWAYIEGLREDLGRLEERVSDSLPRLDDEVRRLKSAPSRQQADQESAGAASDLPLGAVMRYRKKPLVIDAWQWLPGNLEAAGRLVGELLAAGADFHHPSGLGETTTLVIRTLEGEMVAQPGDWVIKGVKGEFYPCKPEIFEATYEPADGES